MHSHELTFLPKSTKKNLSFKNNALFVVFRLNVLVLGIFVLYNFTRPQGKDGT